jgi:predicted negative regulator of RcsB-dependent stress response
LEKEAADKAREIASALLSKYSNSPYAVLTTLNLAAQDVKENNMEAAHARLQWILDQDQLPELIQVARLRKIKLFLSEDKIDAAEKLLTGIDVGEFKGSYAELRGDIALKRKRWNIARSAYAEALLSKDLSQAQHALIQMKLDDLGPQQTDRLEAPFPIDELPPLPSEIASPNTISNNLMVPAELSGAPSSQPEVVPAMTMTPPTASTPQPPMLPTTPTQ